MGRIILSVLILLASIMQQSCSSKKINALEATNDTFNKKFSTRDEYRVSPMLNQLHNADRDGDDRKTFYDKQEVLYNIVAEKNDQYFFDLMNYLYNNPDVDSKAVEVLPVGNSYFLSQFLDSKGTTTHTEDVLYFQYLKFLIDSKNQDYKKEIVDPIKTVVRSDSDSFVDDKIIFTREKIKK